MNKVFDAYSAYYDLLYNDKDYFGEARYVNELIRRYMPDGNTILELGCGTGGHARELSKLGYNILGIDRSPTMIEQARTKNTEISPSGLLTFTEGDLRTFRAGRLFDVVLSLFHVISYQVTNADLVAGIYTAAQHLSKGGLFIFDCWYGPGVLTAPPTTRIRRMPGKDFTITRLAEPVHYPSENRIDVFYEILVEKEGFLERIKETHTMRYLFIPEIKLILEHCGLRLLMTTEWLTEHEPDTATWNACFVCIK